MNRRYKDRCYKYFFTLFPEMVEHSHSDTAHGPSHEWTAFWAEYIVWVGDTGDRYHGED